MIRLVILEDSKDICDIYNHYVENTIATFETESVATDEINNRIKKVIFDFKLPWFVYVIEGRVLGYAYASKWKRRAAYERTVETTIYLNPKEYGNGIGIMLYSALVDWLKELDYHSIIGGISLPNKGSIALHEKLGFKKIGQFKEVGYKFDKWIDVGYWELTF